MKNILAPQDFYKCTGLRKGWHDTVKRSSYSLLVFLLIIIAGRSLKCVHTQKERKKISFMTSPTVRQLFVPVSDWVAFS